MNNFGTFAQKAAEKKHLQKQEQEESYRYFQVRLRKDDFNRVKSAASANGTPIQSLLIDAINLWMMQEDQPPVSNPGTVRAK